MARLHDIITNASQVTVMSTFRGHWYRQELKQYPAWQIYTLCTVSRMLCIEWYWSQLKPLRSIPFKEWGMPHWHGQVAFRRLTLVLFNSTKYQLSDRSGLSPLDGSSGWLPCSLRDALDSTVVVPPCELPSRDAKGALPRKLQGGKQNIASILLSFASLCLNTLLTVFSYPAESRKRRGKT
jgi:hypothetical protein